MMMTPAERKHAFRIQAAIDNKTLGAAAIDGLGVTWTHIRNGIKYPYALSADVKARFAAYIGRSVDEVFGAEAEQHAGAA